MVRFAARQGGFGNVVIVRHWSGLETLYAHLSAIKVKPGDLVASGQLLGKGGATGHATGTHLHLEVRFRGVAIDPSWLIQHQSQQLMAEHVELVRTKYGYAVRPQGCKFHTVKRGDTITRIADRYGVTVQQLKTWNNWSGRIAIRAGQQVRICAPPILN
jgi:murein DD-endopeptidase MepM/ murein hydrolase activator NlpD